MSGIVHHLVRRGLDETHQMLQKTGGESKPRLISACAATALILTLVTYILVMFAIQYTYGQVVAALTMIETPTVTAFKIDGPEPDDSIYADQKADNKNESAVEAELLIVQSKPITAKIRTTMKHLRTQAGVWSRFRALHVFLLYQVALFGLTVLGSMLMPQPLAAVLSSVALCRLDLTWTHIVISNPSSKRWYRRRPNFDLVKPILLPAALNAAVEQVIIYVPTGLFFAFGLHTYARNPQRLGAETLEVQKDAVLKILLVSLTALLATFLIFVPAAVTLTRMQASTLPDEDEPIVPFDRTFGGKVQPRILGGTGAVSMLEAWKTFDWNARVRLLKLYAKIMAIQTVTTVAFAAISALQMKLILSKQAKHTGSQ